MGKQLVLIVEDEPSIRTMTRIALERSSFDVMEAESAATAKTLMAKRLPHLILLDWMLPNLSGISFCKELKKIKLTRDIPIIMLTARAEEENKVAALDAGADDYVVKPFSTGELVARMKAVMRRGLLAQPDGRVEVRNVAVDTTTQRLSIDGQYVHIGPLEYRLLCFFITHPDRVYSRDELLSHVWGGETYIDERTVDVHIRRLRRILCKGGCESLVQTIRGSGYRFSETANA